jgi:hypothetical protein
MKTLQYTTHRRGVLFFCKAGKDRTGLLAALVLACAGASDDQIVADYVKWVWPGVDCTNHLRLYNRCVVLCVPVRAGAATTRSWPAHEPFPHPHNRNRNSDALGRELREAPLTQLWGHFLAATHRERGPLSPPFTRRVAEGISACSMVFHGVFRPAWASPPSRWRDAPGLSG